MENNLGRSGLGFNSDTSTCHKIPMRMGSVGLEIMWSPVHPDKFITWGTEIYLYEIRPITDSLGKQSHHIKTSERTEATLLATNSTQRYVKCIDICPQQDIDLLLAVGQVDGKVVLTSFGTSNIEVSGREFNSLHSRQCNTVAWNPVDSNILAAGWEKSRTEPAVLLWDAFWCHHHRNGDVRGDRTQRALFEFGISETANSLAWVNSTLLAVGLNNKNLKIIDRRDSVKVVNSTSTKAVYGTAVECHNEQILATYFENQICIWDLRNFEKPISTVMRSKQISKILWCPTRHNLLASLYRDSNTIMLHDIQMATVGTEDVEPILLERQIQPSSGHSITSFSWHRSVESRLLTISLTGNITDYYVVERITLNWLPCSHLVWTHGRKYLKVINDRDPIYASFKDISVKIKRRAIAKYGLKPELRQNGDLAEDESLKNLWCWLYSSRTLVENGTIKSVTNYHPGVISVLQLDGLKSRSECSNIIWPDLNSPSFLRIYRSEERDSALHLCGWRFEKDTLALQNFLDKLQMEGLYSRAAAIAVFNLKLRMSIDILSKGAESDGSDSNLSIVAMALSGFSGDKSNMWKEHCMKSRTRLSDPYLRAMFAFLTAENENYENVLSENEMAVKDRVAFACIFLSDLKLSEYLLKLSEKLTEEGNLDGILLTGASAEGAKLLQRYLDATGDVQSVSLLAIRAFPLEIQVDQNVQNWIVSYQQILDSKKLWDQRAHFDLALNTANQQVSQQVFVSCNFCGKSISAYVQGVSRTRGQYTRVGPTNNKMKMSSCPNCRKPLPRCAICLVHMGTPITGINKESDKKTSDLLSWFTWCQTCRHGGHAGHISHWFDNHSECPVTGCTCKCLSLDPGNGIL